MRKREHLFKKIIFWVSVFLFFAVIYLKLITTKGSYNNLNAKNKDYDTLVSFTKN